MGWSNSNLRGQEGWYNAPAAGSFTPQGVHFNFSSPQSMSRGAALTGVSDSTVGAVSFWYRGTGNDASGMRLLDTSTAFTFFIQRTGSGNIQIIIRDLSVTTLFNIATASNVFTAANGNWHHFLASWSTAGGTNMTMYVDGVLDTSTTGTAGTIPYLSTTTDWFFSNSGVPIDADVAEFWFDTGVAFPTQLDLSIAANRQKFINGGNAVNLGTSGQTPSGTSPPVFFSGSVASWNTNKGSGGGFTLNNGPLTAASSNPP